MQENIQHISVETLPVALCKSWGQYREYNRHGPWHGLAWHNSRGHHSHRTQCSCHRLYRLMEAYYELLSNLQIHYYCCYNYYFWSWHEKTFVMDTKSINSKREDWKKMSYKILTFCSLKILLRVRIFCLGWLKKIGNGWLKNIMNIMITTDFYPKKWLKWQIVICILA